MDALARSTYYQYDIGNRLHAVLDPLNKAEIRGQTTQLLQGY